MKKKLVFLVLLSLVVSAYGENESMGKAIWVHPRDMGQSKDQVRDFFALLKKCGITVVFPLVKNTGGAIFWHSKKFPGAVHPDYKEFDLLEAAVRHAQEFGIRIHPWLCDFPESKNSASFRQHPEWAMLNPQGGNTSTEKLGQARPYNPVWMCPVRRPGYSDQWLIPMIEEIVAEYAVDGIHHDYVRYPGDVGPDSYCFCDYCLEHYLAYNFFFYPSRPQDQIHLKEILPRKEANWHYDLTLRPQNWSSMSRVEKASYLLDGSSVNRNDLDYYFYETRVDAITRFVRESTESAREINPNIEISAAVFINPMRSARHIGQRWTDFARWIDILAPMNYRSHFQGSFEDYLIYLSDTIKAQKKWGGGASTLYPGITGHYIYREERESWEKAMEILRSENPGLRKDEFNLAMEKNIADLEQYASDRANSLEKQYTSFLKGKIIKDPLLEGLRNVLSDPPPGFFPEEKFLRTIRTVILSGADGVAIFSAGIISRNKLWEALQKAFSEF
ncbi:MAG: family 10 glycosylhydrolase [Candidatus Aminicenantes bacterium]|jgi:uncharacterized lipoprotein YddW (UPF0748 family)